MKNNLPKHIAFKTLLKHKYYQLNNCRDVRHIIASNQFTIIEYKKHTNAEPVSELIKRLRVENEIQKNDSFLYINNNLKFIFINADLSDDDTCSLLRHELGHICDPDLNNRNLQNAAIQREEFANAFSCYTKNPGMRLKLCVFFMKKWKLFVAAMALVACILGFAWMIHTLTAPPAKPVTGDASLISDGTYYVTSAGKKYHRKHCIIIKYKNNVKERKASDAINEGYKPCVICNPEE